MSYSENLGLLGKLLDSANSGDLIGVDSTGKPRVLTLGSHLSTTGGALDIANLTGLTSGGGTLFAWVVNSMEDQYSHNISNLLNRQYNGGSTHIAYTQITFTNPAPSSYYGALGWQMNIGVGATATGNSFISPTYMNGVSTVSHTTTVAYVQGSYASGGLGVSGVLFFT